MITSLSIGTGGLGRFGNQLYTIAGVIGIADKNGHEFGFPEWKNYDNKLFGGEVDNLNEAFVNPLPGLNGITDFQKIDYFWGYKDIRVRRGNYNINSHLQSPRFFEDSIEKVRHYFTMKDEPEQNDYCAIHYRAGDYTGGNDGYHPRMTKEYYEQAISMMPEGTNFILFSDDPDSWFFMMGGDYEDVDESGNSNYLADFKWMKKCKHFIIANSSFSAMAATLADHTDKKVIAPRRWFGTAAGEMNWNDGYDKNWIVI